MPRLIAGKLVIATHNAGKLREMGRLLAPYGIETVSAGDLGLGEPDETGDSFAANAAIKAEAACAATGLPAFADDSGLCVEAIGGAPGIFSARWGQRAGSYPAAMEAVRQAILAARAVAPYRAHFTSALTLARPGQPLITVEGRCDGELVFPPRGTLGFGYDPIFRPDGQAMTFGEMAPEEKHAIPADGMPAMSHRARAFQAFAKLCLTD